MIPKDQLVQSRVIEDYNESAAFLLGENIPFEAVLSIRNAAHAQLVDCSPLMACNAPGTLAYHYGLLELRVQLLGINWEICSKGGIHGIKSPDGLIKVVFQNVDVACSVEKDPRPRTDKGPGLEREYSCNDLFDHFGVDAPKHVRKQEGTALFAVMVDTKGAVEVSRPVVKNGKFVGFVVRAFVSDGSDLADDVAEPREDLPQPVNDFDVRIESRY